MHKCRAAQSPQTIGPSELAPITHLFKKHSAYITLWGKTLSKYGIGRSPTAAARLKTVAQNALQQTVHSAYQCFSGRELLHVMAPHTLKTGKDAIRGGGNYTDKLNLLLLGCIGSSGRAVVCCCWHL
jgi:hypothetical protein